MRTSVVTLHTMLQETDLPCLTHTHTEAGCRSWSPPVSPALLVSPGPVGLLWSPLVSTPWVLVLPGGRRIVSPGTSAGSWSWSFLGAGESSFRVRDAAAPHWIQAAARGARRAPARPRPPRATHCAPIGPRALSDVAERRLVGSGLVHVQLGRGEGTGPGDDDISFQTGVCALTASSTQRRACFLRSGGLPQEEDHVVSVVQSHGSLMASFTISVLKYYY